MAQKITHWLLITLILSLGFGQLLRFEFLGLPVYFHDFLVVIIILLNIRRLLFVNWNLGIKIFLIGLSLGWLFALLHYPLAQLLVSSLYTLRLLAYLALYFVVKQSKFLIPTSYFLISGGITLCIGLLQYFLLPDMRVFQYLGWDDHLSRLTLPHFDPTFTAVMLGLAFLSSSRYLLPTIYYLPAILLTYSRSVWLSLVFTFGYVMYKNKKFNLLIIGICLLVISISFLPKRFGEGTNLLRTYSIESRISNDLSIIQDQNWDLITGIGMHKGPNNSYLYLLLGSGILGLVGCGMFMFSLYQKSFYKPMLIFFFTASLFNNVMFYPFALLWVLLMETTVPTAT